MLNSLIAKSLPFIPRFVVKAVAGRYIAGETLEDAVDVVSRLNTIGARATVDVLGEFVKSRPQAEHETKTALRVLNALHTNNLQSGMSVKLTSLGLDIDTEFCYANLRNIVTSAAELGLFVRIDMENSPYHDTTLELYKRLRNEKIDNVGVVLQAYMRRSAEDIKSLIPYKASVRLCKGIYNESPDIAYKERDEIRSNFKFLLRMLLENDLYAGIATHDDQLLEYAQCLISDMKHPSDRFEFQMLLGVRNDLRNELIRAGHKLRVYVPFGVDWYGYSVRRLKENPQIAGHVFRAMFQARDKNNTEKI